MRLIDADEAIERFTQIRPNNPKQSDYTHGIDVGLAFAKAAIRDQKTIEPQQRTGKWTTKSTNGEMFDVCSVCGYVEWDNPRNYCPNCGAKMEVKSEEPV